MTIALEPSGSPEWLRLTREVGADLIGHRGEPTRRAQAIVAVLVSTAALASAEAPAPEHVCGVIVHDIVGGDLRRGDPEADDWWAQIAGGVTAIST